MHEIAPGQRWISDTELDMGLGIVLATEHRTISILFPATGEQRTYARQTAPLTRVMFAPGDTIKNQQNETLRVNSVEEEDGLLFYCGKTSGGETTVWPEGQLDHCIQLNRPRERLLAAQVDTNKWFELRYQTLQHTNRLAHSDLYGLTGVRTSLIPHQLFIAHEVAKRYAPRVLLADEVGLGKTIEAGLILHQQLLTERARRVLIVVPETLVHQWLVEMLRRFNLHFSVFDEERCAGIEEGDSTGKENPFYSEQLILCSLDFLCKNNKRSQQVLAGEWDFLVVDEAHHLQWSPTQSSEEYQLIEALAKKTKGVLLLTATPEQLGKESHFARLRLLDPDRFPDFESFVQEEANYRPVAEAVEELLNPEDCSQQLSAQTLDTLRATLSETESLLLIDSLVSEKNDNAEKIKQQLIDRLLDRHGTGRVLFRNTRATVKGFPARQVNAYPLPLPQQYANAYKDFAASNTKITLSSAKNLLCPEQLAQQNPHNPIWTSFDPRVEWLIETLNTLKPQKILVIAANTKTALDIAQAIKAKTGTHVPVFHEQLSIIERDRAAAYFADTENGGQILICSEIGSEGRNFQFSHHLVLFDLPLNPDLLEQRIGRLDRIGQTDIIQIHVPYFTHSPQTVLFDWYHQGLSAFEHTSPAGASVFAKNKEQLLTALATFENTELHQALIQSTQKLATALNEQLHKGRDILLEHNSCLPTVAHTLQEKARKEDANSNIENYLNNVFDCFGVDTEIHSTDCYIVKPGEHMHTHYPGLESDGMKVTFDRNLALSNEDMQFITWEHPIATGALDLVLSSETGNTSLIAIKHPGLSAGTIYLECIYVLEPVAQKELQSKRYLPPTTIHLVTDQHGKNISNILRHELVNQLLIPVDADTAKNVVRSQTSEIKAMIEAGEQLANEKKPQLIAKARQQAMNTLETEIERLRALKAHNPNVREEEIQFFESQREAIKTALSAATVRLDATRIIVAT
ncbi:MAG: RNA polymerase-associated protein RapA [Gammaproteobacteria bacterium]|nr:RNA polymerase-associated protein RapA [Gammaproteobacteria bacterium]